MALIRLSYDESHLIKQNEYIFIFFTNINYTAKQLIIYL